MTNVSKLVAEALGTFMLCFLGAGSICLVTLKGADPIVGLLAVAVAHGLALSIGVSATMNVSGGHANPAVTFAMLVTGRISLQDALQYVAAQLVGGIIAGILVLLIFKGMMTPTGSSVVTAAGLGTPAYLESLSAGRAILIEACLTFLLLFAIFGTAVDPRAPKLGGFAIGLTIAGDILLGGPLTGAAMNPARTFGPGLVAFLGGDLPQFWAQHIVYWIGPCLGAALAAIIYDRFVMEKRSS